MIRKLNSVLCHVPTHGDVGWSRPDLSPDLDVSENLGLNIEYNFVRCSNLATTVTTDQVPLAKIRNSRVGIRSSFNVLFFSV